MIINVSEREIRNHLNYLVNLTEKNVKILKDLLCVVVVLLIKIALREAVSEENKKVANEVTRKLYNRYFKKLNFIFIYIYMVEQVLDIKMLPQNVKDSTDSLIKDSHHDFYKSSEVFKEIWKRIIDHLKATRGVTPIVVKRLKARVGDRGGRVGKVVRDKFVKKDGGGGSLVLSGGSDPGLSPTRGHVREGEREREQEQEDMDRDDMNRQFSAAIGHDLLDSDTPTPFVNVIIGAGLKEATESIISELK